MSETSAPGWRPHRGAAAGVRVLAVALPAAVSAAAAITLGRLLPAPPTLPWALARLGTVLGASVLAVLAVRRATARLLPLGALLSLSLAFPDETPKRLRTALRAPSARQLREDLATDGIARLGQGRGGSDAASRMVTLVTAISAHHRLTRGHSERVRAYADLVAAELGLSTREREMVRWAALLHDLGKLTVPTSILDKPGRPDAGEWRILSGHPAASARLAQPLREWMGEWWHGIGQHHERWDGTGYPDGLAGESISLSARIVALADAFETMTATRSYKRPMSVAQAREELVRCAGSHFDPQVVRAFLNVGLGRLRQVAGLASWLPLPLVNLWIPVRAFAGAAAGQAGGVVAAGAVAVAAVTLAAPAELAAAPPAAPVSAAQWSLAPGRLGELLAAPGSVETEPPQTAAADGSAEPAASGPTPTAPLVGATDRVEDPGAPAPDPDVSGPLEPQPPAPAAAPTTGTPGAGGATTTVRTSATTAPGTTATTAGVTTTPAPPAPTAATTAPGRPTLVADSFTVRTGGIRTIAPLANDHGYDAGSLSIASYPDMLAWVNPDHTISLTVPEHIEGHDRSFTYRACAPKHGACAIATVTLSFRG